jgi:glucokinase
MSAAGNSHTALVGDIGGTNARFALADCSGAKPVVTNIREYPSPNYKQGTDIVRQYLSEVGISPPQIAVIAIAGPIANGEVHLTNVGWTLSETGLQGIGIAKARLLNDFEALALATDQLVPADLHRLGPAQSGEPGATTAVIGPGTGFGASALVRHAGSSTALAAEGGHASFAPNDDVEREILRVMTNKFSHVSIERILSGPGLQNLHAALNEIEGVAPEPESPMEITERALRGEQTFMRTLLRFCAILGSVAGDFALYYGARGGLYIAGGIAPSVLSVLDKSDFRTRFEAKGRFKSYLASIPTYVILHPHPAFLGDAEIARRMEN